MVPNRLSTQVATTSPEIYHKRRKEVKRMGKIVKGAFTDPQLANLLRSYNLKDAIKQKTEPDPLEEVRLLSSIQGKAVRAALQALEQLLPIATASDPDRTDQIYKIMFKQMELDREPIMKLLKQEQGENNNAIKK